MNHRFLAAAAVAVLTAVTAIGADTPKPADPAPPAPAAAVPLKGRLPTHWTKLGLSDTQKQKALTVAADFKGKLAKLEDEIAALKDDEKTQLDAILTPEQRAHLNKIVTGDKSESKK